jgi:4-aminobutyrate aminotransferase-like enzyme
MNSEAWHGMTTYTVEWSVTETVFPQPDRIGHHDQLLSNAPAVVNCGGVTRVRANSANEAMARIRRVIGLQRQPRVKIAA